MLICLVSRSIKPLKQIKVLSSCELVEDDLRYRLTFLRE